LLATPSGVPDPAHWLSTLMKDSERFAALQTGYAAEQARLWAALFGGAKQPLVAPDAGDRRFSSKEWQDNPYYSYL